MGRPSRHYGCPASENWRLAEEQTLYVRKGSRWIAIGSICLACRRISIKPAAVDEGVVAGPAGWLYKPEEAR
jgi:hypothetical protein